ncbi:Oxysterol binding protein [Aphelenchoides avenae]|nr:Oxysterol binding protein [Aphelenchus avenae]
MEGALSKWTNLVQGWQYRYFVLNDDVLCYYTSRDKMLRGQQRGCIRLRGAAIGIDGENNSLFTITVDGKTFHLQGRDQAERDMWVRALEKVIHDKCGYYKPRQQDPVVELKAKACHAENQLTDLIEQVRKLEHIEHQNAEKLSAKRRRMLQEITRTAKRLQSTVDHSVIILNQVQRAFGEEGTNGHSDGKDDLSEQGNEIAGSNVDEPPITYCSSEEEFFDADEGERDDESDASEPSVTDQSVPTTAMPNPRKSWESTETEPDWGDSNENFDEIYEKNNEESDLGDIQQQHGSVLMHLLSQVSVGMDLTKVTLPTFILERRSLLEMYADFFAHPDDFVRAVDLPNPEERFISVVRYYLNAFYPARKSGVAKKPYNPILGETFRCRWTIPELPPSGEKVERGPFPGSDKNQVTFFAEQVSHHPPVSAFYAEHPGKRVSLNAHIWTKSSFLGLSIGVTNIGKAVVTLHDFGEQYTVTFPNGYGRSIMSTPWVELGGKVEIKCEKTGYHGEIEFQTKPFFGGKPHRIQGSVYKQGLKKPVMTLRGEWNGVIYAKKATGDEFVFTDVRAKPEVRKECEPVETQGERESRRLWRHVTAALYHNKINIASGSKRWIEQRQREEAKRRLEAGQEWQTSRFHKEGDNWVYDEPLNAEKEKN